MGKYALFTFKLILLTLIVIYANFFEMTVVTNKVCATLMLFFSLLFLYKSRKNLPLFLVAFFILYCNYSIAVGEYFVGGDLGAPMIEVKTLEIYGLTVRALLLFISTVALFFKTKKVDFNKFKVTPVDNIVAFYGLLLVLLGILLFGVKRGDLSSYTVSITPMYEYSSLLIFFAYYTSGRSPIRKALLTGLIIMFILQDFYYGGRITSLQLILLFLITILLKKLSVKLILIGGSVGIFINSFVDAYRQSYSLDSISAINVFNNMVDKLFVFNTPVYAFYASATHVAAEKYVSLQEKLYSFFDFFSSIFVGSSGGIGDVTHYVSWNYFHNHGGGVVMSHFYFWFGWTGVIIAATIIVFILNRLGLSQNDFWKMIAITVIYSVPRWYLYTPLSLFRPLLLMSILYLIYRVIHSVLFKIAGKRSLINKESYYTKLKVDNK